MKQAQTPLEATLHLSSLIHAARRSLGLSANLALQLTYTEGPHRSVPAPVVADALSQLLETLEDAEDAVVWLESLLQPEPETAATSAATAEESTAP